MELRTKRFLQKTKIHVEPEHDMVKLTIGNWGLDLPYDVALKLSQWMRVAGKKAKRNAGDTSRSWSIVGQLTDAQAEFKKGAGWW